VNEPALRRRFEALLATVDPPLVVVTATAGRRRAGGLVAVHTQVSIAPHRYLVALSPRNHTADVAADAEHLAVHTIAADRRDLAERLGGRCSVDDVTFSHVGWAPWDDGTPLLDDAAGWFVGRISERRSLGDHDGILLDVRDVGPSSAAPLLSSRSLGRLPAGHAP
jgi:flavin reductase (DIM6/NTAB) family NADH-FMN oxidoreductase RutF